MKAQFFYFFTLILLSSSLQAQVAIPDSAVIDVDESIAARSPEEILMDSLYSAITRQEVVFGHQDTFFDKGKSKTSDFGDFAIGLRAGYDFATYLSAKRQRIDYGANPSVVLYGTLFSTTISLASFDVGAAGYARTKLNHSPSPDAKWWKPAFRADFLILGKSVKQWKETDPEQVAENAANKIKTELGEMKKGASDLVPGMALSIPIVGPLQAYIDFGIISNFNFNMALALMPDMANFKNSMASFMVGPSVRQSFFLEVGALLNLGVGKATVAIAGIINMFDAQIAGIVSFKPSEMKIPIGLNGSMAFLSGTVMLKADITIGTDKFGVQKGWSKTLFSWTGVTEQMNKMIGVIDLSSPSEFFTLCLDKDPVEFPDCSTVNASNLMTRANLVVPASNASSSESSTPTCGPGSPQQWIEPEGGTAYYGIVPCAPTPPPAPGCPNCAISYGPEYVNCPGPVPTVNIPKKSSSTLVAVLNNVLGVPTCDATLVNCYGCCKNNAINVFKVYAPWSPNLKVGKSFELVGVPSDWTQSTLQAPDIVVSNLRAHNIEASPSPYNRFTRTPMQRLTAHYGSCVGDTCNSLSQAWVHIYRNVSSDLCYKSTGSDPTIGADSASSITCKRPTTTTLDISQGPMDSSRDKNTGIRVTPTDSGLTSQSSESLSEAVKGSGGKLPLGSGNTGSGVKK